MATNDVDPRLNFLLDGGKALLCTVDPERIARKARVKKVVLVKTGQEEFSWTLSLLFEGNDCLLANGRIDNDTVEVKDVRMLAGREWQQLPVKASKTLCEALAPLDRLPVRAKRLLSPTAPEADSLKTSKPFSAKGYYDIAVDALFWETEGGEKNETRDRFERLRVDFDKDGKASMSATCRLQEGEVSVKCDIEQFGLSRKKVLVRKGLGMKREMRAECFHATEKKDIPSVMVAFDLYAAVPTIYTKERKQKSNVGLPKAVR